MAQTATQEANEVTQPQPPLAMRQGKRRGGTAATAKQAPPATTEAPQAAGTTVDMQAAQLAGPA